MEQSSSERKQTVRHQFDSFCKMVLHGEKVNYEKEMEYRRRHEISSAGGGVESVEYCG